MNEVIRFLVDLDGVFADYLTPSLRLWGFDPANYPPNQWNTWEALGISLSDYVGTIDKQPNFWREIKPYPWKDALVGFLDDLEIPWSIVTSPWLFQHPTLHSDKVAWVREHIGRSVKCNIVDDKFLMAKPQHLLIDDGHHQVSAFIAHGGQAVLFPQRWNELHQVTDPFSFVTRAVAEIVAGEPVTNRPMHSTFSVRDNADISEGAD